MEWLRNNNDFENIKNEFKEMEDDDSDESITPQHCSTVPHNQEDNSEKINTVMLPNNNKSLSQYVTRAASWLLPHGKTYDRATNIVTENFMQGIFYLTGFYFGNFLLNGSILNHILDGGIFCGAMTVLGNICAHKSLKTVALYRACLTAGLNGTGYMFGRFYVGLLDWKVRLFLTMITMFGIRD